MGQAARCLCQSYTIFARRGKYLRFLGRVAPVLPGESYYTRRFWAGPRLLDSGYEPDIRGGCGGDADAAPAGRDETLEYPVEVVGGDTTHRIGTLGEYQVAESLNPFTIAQEQLDQAAELLKLDKATHMLLREPMRELHVSFPVRMDDGRHRVFKGFRVQYNDARGPTKGGIRFHPDETIDTVRALAAWMTWKTAVVEIPLGGGYCGVICYP